uniref:R3H domain-containing protein n=1 Tax=Anopheles farauti TaxID=69004 RepID=A0A182QQA3_9DIPT
MDLLGSILGSMDKPPVKDKQEKQKFEKQKKVYESMKNHQREELNRFRVYAEERLGRLMKDSNRHFMEFQPLDQVHRSIVHDIAETAGLSAVSFGVEGERYIVVYKKEHPPSEDELNARKNGEIWNQEVAEQYAERRLLRLNQLKEQSDQSDNNKSANAPVSDYNKKYRHLFGQDAAMDVASRTQINRSYGYVPSENKKDVRSIEQTMADIVARKKLKTQKNEPAAVEEPSTQIGMK